MFMWTHTLKHPFHNYHATNTKTNNIITFLRYFYCVNKYSYNIHVVKLNVLKTVPTSKSQCNIMFACNISPPKYKKWYKNIYMGHSNGVQCWVLGSTSLEALCLSLLLFIFFWGGGGVSICQVVSIPNSYACCVGFKSCWFSFRMPGGFTMQPGAI